MRKFKSQVVEDLMMGSFHFPVGDNVIAPYIRSRGIWEPSEHKWLQQNVESQNSCLNVGANVGYFTILMSILAGESGSVTALEPNKELLPYLRENIESRSIKNVKIYPYAAGNERKKARFYINRENYGDGRMFDPRLTTGGGDWRTFGFDQIPHKTKVQMIRIDDLHLENIDIALIDTQGFDHMVLRGMLETIKRHPPKILTEFIPQWIQDLGENPAEVLKEYKSWGFKVESTDLPELNHLGEVDFIKGILRSKSFFTNLALTPK